MKIEDINSLIQSIYKKKYKKDIPNDEDNTDLGTVLKEGFVDNLPDTPAYSKDIIQEYFEYFHKIQTIGDGTCFIHSFLTSVSKTYRRIPYNERSEVGQVFRKEVFYNLVDSIDTKSDIATNLFLYKDIKKRGQQKKEMLQFIKSNQYFESQHIDLFLKVMTVVNLMAFSIVKKRSKDDIRVNSIQFISVDDKLPYIITLNTNETHFSAVVIKDFKDDRWELLKEDSDVLQKLYSTQEEKVELKCDYNDGDIINYNNRAYIVIGREFNDKQECYKLKIRPYKNSNNSRAININISDVQTNISNIMASMSVKNIVPPSKEDRILELLFELSELLDSDSFKDSVLDEISIRTQGGKKKPHKNRTRRIKRNAK